jgi:ABC-2 type transport system permease protein
VEDLRGAARTGLAEMYPPLSGRGLPALTLRLCVLNVKAAVEYRLDFLFSVLQGITYQLIGILFIWAVLTRFPSLGGWEFGEVAFLYALRLLSHSVYLPFLWNLIGLSDLVRQGELDRLLLRPVHPLLLVVTRTFKIVALGDLTVAVAVFAVAQSALRIDWSAGQLLSLVLVLAGGALIEAAVQLFAGSLAVWLVNATRLHWWADEVFNTFGHYPLTIYDRALQLGFTYLVPLAFVAYIPATAILGRQDELRTVGLSPLVAYGTPIVGVLTAGLALAFFHFALGRYQSTGN